MNFSVDALCVDEAIEDLLPKVRTGLGVDEISIKLGSEFSVYATYPGDSEQHLIGKSDSLALACKQAKKHLELRASVKAHLAHFVIRKIVHGSVQ